MLSAFVRNHLRFKTKSLIGRGYGCSAFAFGGRNDRPEALSPPFVLNQTLFVASPLANSKSWSTIIRLTPRNLFLVPSRVSPWLAVVVFEQVDFCRPKVTRIDFHVVNAAEKIGAHSVPVGDIFQRQKSVKILTLGRPRFSLTVSLESGNVKKCQEITWISSVCAMVIRMRERGSGEDCLILGLRFWDPESIWHQLQLQ